MEETNAMYETESSINPIDYLKMFFRRKWLIAAPAFLGLVIGIVAGFILPKSYQSSTLILVEEEKVINPLISGLAVSTSVSSRMNTIKEQVMSWNNLVKLSQKLNMVKDVTNQAEFEDLIKELRNNIQVRMRGRNLISIGYNNPNPQKALDVVKALNELFIQTNIDSQTKETDVAILFIKDQLKVYKRKIKEAEVSTIQDKLNNLLVDTTEKHPLVKEYRQEIATLNKQLESGEYDVDVDSMQPIPDPIYKRIEEELKGIQQDQGVALGLAPEAQAGIGTQGQVNDLYKILAMDKLDAVAARDARVNENIYNMLLQRLESAKITQRLEASKEGTRYTVLDPPRLPLKPVKPNKLLVIFMGLFIGGISGVGLVIGSEFIDSSILDINEAKKVLSLPILGAISKISTVEEIDKQKLRTRKAVSISLAVSASVIIVVMLFSFFTRP